MKKLIIVLTCILSSVSSFSQDTKTGDKFEFIKMMMFESLKMSFPQTAEPFSNELKTKYEFPWVEIAKFNKLELTTQLTNLSNKYASKLENKKVVLTSSFTDEFEFQEKYLNIKITAQQLKNEAAALVTLKPKSDYMDIGSTSSFSEELDSNGNVISSKTSVSYTLEKPFESKTAFKHLNGTITVETKHLLSYNYKKISTSDIGKEIVFGANKIKVISMKDNIFTYQLIEGDGEYSHFATNANDVPYKENYSSSRVSQQDLDFIKLHPNFTQADVNQYFESIKEQLSAKKIVKNIVIVRYVGVVSNIYLYKPAEYISVNKIVKIKL